MAVSLVRPKFCPSGGGSALLENGYGIERDRALSELFKPISDLLHRAQPTSLSRDDFIRATLGVNSPQSRKVGRYRALHELQRLQAARDGPPRCGRLAETMADVETKPIMLRLADHDELADRAAQRANGELPKK